MPPTDDYAGILGIGVSLSITPPGGNPAKADIQGILDMTPPSDKYNLVRYTPISGVRAGKEQTLVSYAQSPQCSVTVVYEASRHNTLRGVKGINGSAIVFTFPDGATLTGTGVLAELSIQQITDNKEMTVNLLFALSADWTFVPGA